MGEEVCGLVCFDSIELELLLCSINPCLISLVWEVVFYGSFRWLLIMVVHTFDGESLVIL